MVVSASFLAYIFLVLYSVSLAKLQPDQGNGCGLLTHVQLNLLYPCSLGKKPFSTPVRATKAFFKKLARTLTRIPQTGVAEGAAVGKGGRNLMKMISHGGGRWELVEI